MSINELEAKARELRQLQALIDEAQAEAEALKDAIKAAMGDREAIQAGEIRSPGKPSPLPGLTRWHSARPSRTWRSASPTPRPPAGFVWRKGSPAAEVPAKIWGYPCRICRRPCVRFGHRGHIPSRPTVVGFSDNGGFFIQERRARSRGAWVPYKSAGACRFAPPCLGAENPTALSDLPLPWCLGQLTAWEAAPPENLP